MTVDRVDRVLGLIGPAVVPPFLQDAPGFDRLGVAPEGGQRDARIDDAPRARHSGRRKSALPLEADEIGVALRPTVVRAQVDGPVGAGVAEVDRSRIVDRDRKVFVTRSTEGHRQRRAYDEALRVRRIVQVEEVGRAPARAIGQVRNRSVRDQLVGGRAAIVVKRVDRQGDPVPILLVEGGAGDGDVGSSHRLEAPRRWRCGRRRDALAEPDVNARQRAGSTRTTRGRAASMAPRASAEVMFPSIDPTNSARSWS